MSGKSLYKNTLRTVKMISSKYDIPIIATGGVSSYENVNELLKNGASLTGMATLLVSDPFQIPLINKYNFIKVDNPLNFFEVIIIVNYMQILMYVTLSALM